MATPTLVQGPLYAKWLISAEDTIPKRPPVAVMQDTAFTLPPETKREVTALELPTPEPSSPESMPKSMPESAVSPALGSDLEGAPVPTLELTEAVFCDVRWA